jgi:hypothetical protein
LARNSDVKALTLNGMTGHARGKVMLDMTQ